VLSNKSRKSDSTKSDFKTHFLSCSDFCWRTYFSAISCRSQIVNHLCKTFTTIAAAEDAYKVNYEVNNDFGYLENISTQCHCQPFFHLTIVVFQKPLYWRSLTGAGTANPEHLNFPLVFSVVCVTYFIIVYIFLFIFQLFPVDPRL
jgi:hypothetical protein